MRTYTYNLEGIKDKRQRNNSSQQLLVSSSPILWSKQPNSVDSNWVTGQGTVGLCQLWVRYCNLGAIQPLPHLVAFWIFLLWWVEDNSVYKEAISSIIVGKPEPLILVMWVQFNVPPSGVPRWGLWDGNEIDTCDGAHRLEMEDGFSHCDGCHWPLRKSMSDRLHSCLKMNAKREEDNITVCWFV